MHAVGIIAEYNPFHKGHAYHVDQTRQCSGADVVIAVMSGHMTQRGELTIFDKWHRAQSAVLSGVDLVLELPAVFAVRSAQYFAVGGVRLLHSLGIVNQLAFGAEEEELSALESAAISFDNNSVSEQLKINLGRGQTYAAAIADAIVSAGHATTSLIRSPNNILGIEYIRALKKWAPEITPLPIRRIGSHFRATEIGGEYSSATAIRAEIFNCSELSAKILDTLPPSTVDICKDLFASGWAPALSSRLDNVVLSKVRHMTNAQLQILPELSEGLENRLKKAANQAGTTAELLTCLKSKRYPYSRLQRILAHLLLETTSQKIEAFDHSGPLYARVLALNDHGRSALRIIAQRSSIPVITKTTTHLNSRTFHSGNFTLDQAMLAIDINATDLFSLCLPDSANRKGGLDFTRSAIHIPTTA